MTEPTQDHPLPYIGPERREGWHTPGNCPMAEATKSRLSAGDERMNRIEEALRLNTEATKEVLEIVSMGKGFFKTVGAIGFVIKWIAGVALAIFAAYQAYKNGV